MNVLESDFNLAVDNVVSTLDGILQLYEGQKKLLRNLVDRENVFYTSPTNSGKTIPPVILPAILKELNKLGYNFPVHPKVLFVTVLNSLQASLVTSMDQLGIISEVLNKENAEYVLASEATVIFVGPEILKLNEVSKALLQQRSKFVCKVIDEAHLGKIFAKLSPTGLS